MVLYSHFRSEHLLVHHRYVGTPRDPVTARYNEGSTAFSRACCGNRWHSVLPGRAPEMLARKGRPWSDRSNPFWRYWALQGQWAAGGAARRLGSGLAAVPAAGGRAIWQLEL